jgi:hypothetical protein
MNTTLYNSTDTELDIHTLFADTAMHEDMHATTPMAVVRATYWQPSEEELHTSFEQAISDRVLAVNRQLKRLSCPLTDALPVQSQTDTTVTQRSLATHLTLLEPAWQQRIRYIAIAFLLVMVGFDLMGLLVLRLH